jgi:metallophosphoesterase superfamily enzyme
MPTDEVEEIVIGHIHPSQPAKTPVALSSPFRFDERVSVTVCPAFGSGISNFSYKDQNRMNDFIESIPQSSVLKSFEADVSE